MRDGERDTVVSFASKLAVLALSVAIQSSLAWLLRPEGRGSYAVALLYGSVLATIFGFGADRAGQYFVASGGMKRSHGVWATIAALLVGSAVGIVVGRALMTLDLSFFDKAARGSFYIGLALVPFAALGNAFIFLFVGLNRIREMAIVSVVNVAVQFAVGVFLIVVLRMGVNGALLAVVFSNAAAIALSLWYLHRLDSLERVPFSELKLGQLFSYGARYQIAGLGNMANFRVGTMILALFATPVEIGLFAAISGLVTRVLMIPDAIETALFSRVAGDPAGRPDLVGEAARVSAIASGASLLVLALLARPLVWLLLSPEFLPGLKLLWILVPGVFLRATSKVLMSYFMGTNRPAICSWSVGIGALANLAALFILIPAIGFSGAAWAMTLGYVVSSAILIEVFRRVAGRPLSETWGFRRGDVLRLVDLVRRMRPGAVWRGPERGRF